MLNSIRLDRVWDRRSTYELVHEVAVISRTRGNRRGPWQQRRSASNSSKAGDERTLGEKAIDMLAFQQLGAKLDIVSRAHGSTETHVLKLARGEVNATIDREKRRARDRPGTSIYIGHLDKEVLHDHPTQDRRLPAPASGHCAGHWTV